VRNWLRPANTSPKRHEEDISIGFNSHGGAITEGINNNHAAPSEENRLLDPLNLINEYSSEFPHALLNLGGSQK
jgi:hypothetical protein